MTKFGLLKEDLDYHSIAGRLDVKPARIFGFDEIREAHRVMEANEAVGKMVVVRA